MSGCAPDHRQRLIETVHAWLDELDRAEPAPPGLAPDSIASPDPAPDLFSVLGQLSALTRETQLQGRATNRLHAELGQALDRLTGPTTHGEPAAAGQDLVRQLGRARREARTELVSELLEVRDHLSRNLAEAERRLASLRGLRARLGQRPVLEALVKGTQLAQERLDDLLRRLDVYEIRCLNAAFNPNLMRVAAVSHTTAAASGTVLAVIRPGYTCNGQVLRFAEVQVARSGTGETAEKDADKDYDTRHYPRH